MTVYLRRDLAHCVCHRPVASPPSCCQGCCQPSACLTAASSGEPPPTAFAVAGLKTCPQPATVIHEAVRRRLPDWLLVSQVEGLRGGLPGVQDDNGLFQVVGLDHVAAGLVSVNEPVTFLPAGTSSA